MPTDIDRVLETTLSTGTGALVLNGPEPGYRAFQAAVGVGGAVTVCVEAVDAAGVPTGPWEICDATLAGASLLARGAVRSSSTGARVDFGAGRKRVFAHVPSVRGQDLSHTHAQAVPAATWTVAHGLGKCPGVTVVDSAGDQVVGAVSYPDANTVVITFSAAFAGTAYLN